MRAVLTAVIAAIEAAAIAVAVFFAVAIVSGLLWWLVFDLAAEPDEVVTTAVAVWQLVHLVPMQVSLSAVTALSLGLPAEPLSFVFSLAPLGLTAVTVLLAFRSGWRFAGRGSSGVGAVLGGTVGFAAAAVAAAMFSAPMSAWPVPAQIAVVTLVYAVPILLAFVVRAALDGQEWWLTFVTTLLRALQRVVPQAGSGLRGHAVAVLRLALASLAGLLGLGALGFAAAIVASYVDVIALGQGMHLDVLGAVLVFLLQLSLVPVAWIWSLAWFAGPGFAVGTATSVTPFEVLLGPLPTLPLLGALPEAWGWAGALAPTLVVAVGAAVGGLLATGFPLRRASILVSLAVPLCAAVLVGLCVAFFSFLASGSIGPGRLAEIGPEPWLVGGVVAAELAFGMALGVFARRFDVDRLRHSAAVAALMSTEETVRTLQPGQGEAARGERDSGRLLEQRGDNRNADAETVPIDPLPDDYVMPPVHELPMHHSDTPVDDRPVHRSSADSNPTDGSSTGDRSVPGFEAPESDRDSLLSAYSWESHDEATEKPERPGLRDRLSSKFRRKAD